MSLRALFVLGALAAGAVLMRLAVFSMVPAAADWSVAAALPERTPPLADSLPA